VKKIAILTVAVVLVLSSLGVGFAKWFDRINIEGTVTTGSVDLVVVDYSGTYVYKDLDHDDPGMWNGGFACVVSSPDPLDEGTIEEAGLELISYAEASQTMDGDEPVDDAVTVVFDNLFPTLDRDFDFVADVVFHYEGTIPARLYLDLDDIEFGEGSEWIGELIEDGYVWAEMYYVEPADGGWEPTGETVEPCDQLHYCDYIKLDIHFAIPQFEDEEANNEMMNLSGSATFHFDVVQWNETLGCGES